jgi:hypothetical protein
MTPSIGTRTRTLLAMLALAAAAATSPLHAQDPATQKPQPTQKEQPARSLKLTEENRHIIRELIIKDMKTQPLTAQIPAKVGEQVPPGVALQPVPVEVAVKVPQLKSYSYFVKDDAVLIVDPRDNRIAERVE